jgi:type VI secretion system protein ImpH
MEAEDRHAIDRLSLLRDIAANPGAYGFYHVVRLIECAHPELPRIGASRRLREDPVRFAQEIALDFAASTVGSMELPPGQKPRLLLRFTGLTGPNGPMPLHLTEFARDRLRNHGDRTLIRFFDTFHHRVFSMFYRAWADAQPTVSLDRPGDDPVGNRLAAFGGYGGPKLRHRDDVPDAAKLAHIGLLGNSVRNADGLARIVSNYFRVPARVEQWHPHWMKLPPDSLTRLGAGQPNACLGVSAVVGAKVWDCQSRFRIVLGPLGLGSYERFLPGKPGLKALKTWVLNYIGHELSCELQLLLKRPDVPSIRLGRAGQLGWTSWLGSRPPTGPSDAADELILRVT